MDIVFGGQVIIIKPEWLSVDTVQHIPEVLAVEATEETDAVNAIAESWILSLQLDVPKGTIYPINGHPTVVDRMRLFVPTTTTPEVVASVFGEAYESVLFAVSNGVFKPTGEILDGFLSVAVKNLQNSAEETSK